MIIGNCPRRIYSFRRSITTLIFSVSRCFLCPYVPRWLWPSPPLLSEFQKGKTFDVRKPMNLKNHLFRDAKQMPTCYLGEKATVAQISSEGARFANFPSGSSYTVFETCARVRTVDTYLTVMILWWYWPGPSAMHHC